MTSFRIDSFPKLLNVKAKITPIVAIKIHSNFVSSINILNIPFQFILEFTKNYKSQAFFNFLFNCKI